MVQHADLDHTGVTGVSGNVAADAIWDAAGDLAVGSGANTAAKLSIGATNGMALQRVSGSVAWALPPAYEFDYVAATSDVSITATSEATANTIVTANAVTYDGSTVIYVEFYTYALDQGTTFIALVLYDGSSSIGRIGLGLGATRVPALVKRRLTPSAAAHTYSIRAYVDAGTGTAEAGAGGNGNKMPLYIRQYKA